MKRHGRGNPTPRTRAITLICAVAIVLAPAADAYLFDTTAPSAPGCPQNDRWNLSLSHPLNRQWSSALPTTRAIVTAAQAGTSAQLNEVEQVIDDSFGAWSAVSGATINAASYPGILAPLARISTANACSNDQESNIDGLNTICFNQQSAAFTGGVLAFTRVITANAPGVSVGASGPAVFAGQILDADTLFRPDGQSSFATPAALATSPGAYDLESLLIHELGHWLGFDHSPVWRAVMFPFAPPPGQFLGNRPTPESPDGPLADDDRTGLRALYPDPDDLIDIGAIRGRVVPANPFSLAFLPQPTPQSSVTGIFGAHVVAIDSESGAVIAGGISGWSCNDTGASPQFDGSYNIERLPTGHGYTVYAEPLDGLVTSADIAVATGSLCSAKSGSPCITPAVNTTFNARIRPSAP